MMTGTSIEMLGFPKSWWHHSRKTLELWVGVILVEGIEPVPKGFESRSTQVEVEQMFSLF